MTTNQISVEFGRSVGRPVVSVVSTGLVADGMPRVRRQPVTDAGWAGAGEPISYKSTRVSVPGCRGIT